MILADGSVYPQKGEFAFADRQVDVRTGTIRVTVLFPNPINLLRPGQFARVRAEMGIKKGALVIPQRAVTEVQGRYLVAVVGPENKVSIKPVKVGVRFGQLWVIDEGLQAGQKVVAEGTQKVRDGMVVSPKPFGAEAPAEPGRTETRGKAGSQTPTQTGKEVNRHGEILHQSADRRHRHLHHHGHRGRGGHPGPAHCPVPEHRPAGDRHQHHVCGRGCADGRAVGRHPHRAGDERRRQHELHVLAQRQQRRAEAVRQLRREDRPEHRPGPDPDPQEPGRFEAAPGSHATTASRSRSRRPPP